MNSWEEIESQPEFGVLNPEDKKSLHDIWKDSVLSAALEADPDQIDSDGVHKFVATAEARSRSLAEGKPFDEATALKEYQRSVAERTAAQNQVLADYDEYEMEQGKLRDAESSKAASLGGFGVPNVFLPAEIDAPVREAQQRLDAVASRFTPEMLEQVKAAREAIRGERPVAQLGTDLYTDPALTLNKEEYRKAVAESGASMEAKAKAIADFSKKRKAFAQAAAATLQAAGESPIPGVLDFPTWESRLPREQYLQPPEEKALQYMREMKGRDGFRKVVSAIATGIMQGGVDIASQSIGVAALATQDPKLAAKAAEVSKAAETLGEVQKLEGDLTATGATTAGGMARLGTSMAPPIAGSALTGGGLPVASLLAGAQTTGAQFPSTFSALKEQGKSDEEALRAATGSSLMAGAVTTALTAMGGATGVEALVRQGGKEFAKREIAKRIATGALKEVPEEVLDEAASQIIEAQTVTPDKPVAQVVDEFMATVPDLALQVALLGAGAETFKAITERGGRPQEAGPQPVAPAPDTDFARRAAMEGATEFRDTTAGVPVVVEGVTIATIPPGSDLSPDDVAAFAAEPDMLKTLARSGQITLPEIVKPVEGVDETLTDEMNQNIAAGAVTAPATVTALEEVETLARERQAAEETLRSSIDEAVRTGRPFTPEEQAFMLEQPPPAGQPVALSGSAFDSRNTEMLPDEDDFGGKFDQPLRIKPDSYVNKDGIETVEYTNPETGVVDAYISAFGNNDFIAYMRVYDENGNPTNRFTSKLERRTNRPGATRAMIEELQSRLPPGHQYAEDVSVSTDGLRFITSQLKQGYSVATNPDGTPITTEVAISGESITNDLPIAVDPNGKFENIRVSTPADFAKVKEFLGKKLESFGVGLNASNVRWENGTAYIDLPVLQRQAPATQRVAEKVETLARERQTAEQPQPTQTDEKIRPRPEESLRQANSPRGGDRTETKDAAGADAGSPAATPTPTEESVKLGLTPDESGATGAGMKEEIQQTPERAISKPPKVGNVGAIPTPEEAARWEAVDAFTNPYVASLSGEDLDAFGAAVGSKRNGVGDEAYRAKILGNTHPDDLLDAIPDVAAPQPITPTREEPTDSLPADQPTSGDVGAQRDLTKPEQMTPVEILKGVFGASVHAGEKIADRFVKKLMEWDSLPLDKQAAFMRDRYPDYARAGRESGVTGDGQLQAVLRIAPHQRVVNAAVEAKKPVSAEAVDTYGITLPDGYVKQGELYVFQQGQAQGEVTLSESGEQKYQRIKAMKPSQRSDADIAFANEYSKQQKEQMPQAGERTRKAFLSNHTATIHGKLRKALDAQMTMNGLTGTVGSWIETLHNQGWRMAIDARGNRQFTNGNEALGTTGLGKVGMNYANFLSSNFPQPTAVAPQTETPSNRAKVAGGSQGVQTEPAEGSIPAVTTATVPPAATESTGEVQPASSLSEGDFFRIGDNYYTLKSKLKDGRIRAVPVSGPAFDQWSKTPELQSAGVVIAKNRKVVKVAPSPPAAPRNPAENLVSFTAANGQKLVGEVQSVTGNKATVAYQWNGKTKTQVVPVSQLGSPVASVATPPKYLYNQEQNTRKLGKHFPTSLGVHANHDFRKSFASMAEDTSLSQIYRMVAKVLAKMPEFKGIDLHLVADENIKYAGEYSWNNGKPSIAINLRYLGRGKVDALGSILHEALHHVTLAKVRNPQGAYENEVVGKLDAIREKVIEYAESRGLAKALDYELGSLEEFITAIFTRPDFQALLASIPDSAAPGVAVGKFRSILSEIFRRIAELVTGKPVLRGSALEQAMTTSLALFNTPFRGIETGGLEALNAARSPGKGLKALFPQTGDKAAKPSALAEQWWAATTRQEARAILEPASLEELKAIAVRMDENPNQPKAKLIDRLVQITGVYADAVGIRGADAVGPRGPMPDYTGQKMAAQQRMREQKAARAQQPKERGLPKAKPRTPEEFARDMAALMARPASETKPINLSAAYQKATVGKSSQWVTIKEVYEQAKADNPSLTPEAFMAQIEQQNEAGGVMISPVENVSTVEAARPFVVGNAGVEMLVPSGTAASRIDEETDAEYLAAVEAGDMEKAQAMVDAAAKAAGYEIEAWHGTPSYGFTQFDPQKSGQRDTGWLGEGIYFSQNKKIAEQFRARVSGRKGGKKGVYHVYLRGSQPISIKKLASNIPAIVDRSRELKGLPPKKVSQPETSGLNDIELSKVVLEYGSPMSFALGMGYDSVTADMEGGTVLVAQPWQIKSADPVTRDEQGNVIPLSQRFNPESPSIAYSRIDEGEPPIDIGGVAEPADGGGTQLFQKDPTAIGSTYITPADITLQERRSQEETLAKARKIIAEEVQKDEKGGRAVALQRFKSDLSIPPEVRTAGTGLIAQQADLLANLERDAIKQEGLDALADEAGKVSGIVGSDLEYWRNLQLAANLDIDKMAEEAGRTLNIFNVFRRLTPEGFLRRMKRQYNATVQESMAQTFELPPGDVEEKVRKAVSEKPKDREKAVKDLLKKLKPKPRAPREKIEKALKALFTAAETGALDSQEFFDALGEALGHPPLTAEQQERIKKLTREINALPKGAARVDKQQELDEELALWKGIAARDALLSAWYANILSGISTQGIGLFGNLVNFIPRSLFLAATNPRSAKAYFRGAFGEGLETGLREAAAALKGRGLYKVSKYGDKNMVSALELLRKKGPATLPEWIAYIASGGTRLRYVFRIMQAIDALAWNTAREGQAYLAAHRALLDQQRADGVKRTPEEFYRALIDNLGGDAKQIEEDMRAAREELIARGQTPDLLTVDRMAREARNARRSSTGTKLSNRFADRIVMQQDPEGIGDTISSIITVIQKKGNIAGIPFGQLLIPFNKIVANLFEQSLDYTPIGALRAYLGGHLSDLEPSIWRGKVQFKDKSVQFDAVERAERRAASVTGTLAASVMFALASLFKDEPDEDVPFMLYGFGPESKNKRDQMPKGWTPYSAKIGDTYIKFSEMPFGVMFAAAGNALDAMRYKNMDKKSSAERLAYVLKTSAKGFTEQGVLSSFDTAFEVLTFQASDKKFTDVPVNIAKGMVPGQGMLRDMSVLFDPVKIKDDTISAALLRDFPVVRRIGTRPALNVFGEPVTFDGRIPFVRRIATVREEHAAADYLGRNRLSVPGMAQTIVVGQYLPKDMRDRIQRRALETSAMENGVFTVEQDYNFRKRAGELTKVAVENLMKQVPTITSDKQRENVQKLINKKVEIARRRAMLEAVPAQ